MKHDELDKYGTMTVYPYGRDHVWSRWQINTKDIDPETGKLVDRLTVYYGNQNDDVAHAREYANKILELCDLAESLARGAS